MTRDEPIGRYDLALTQADVAAIAAGSTVSVTAAPGVTFEVTSEDGWGGPSRDPSVYRFGLSDRKLDRLRWGRTVAVLPVGFDGSVHFTAADAEVTR